MIIKAVGERKGAEKGIPAMFIVSSSRLKQERSSITTPKFLKQISVVVNIRSY
jgi:hypothetical protein